MVPLIVLAIVIAVLVAIYASVQRSSKADEAWQEAAKRLDMRYQKAGPKRQIIGKLEDPPTDLVRHRAPRRATA